MNIAYAVLLSEGNEARRINVDKMKESIEGLQVVVANKTDVFDKHIKLFAEGTKHDGIVILEDDVQLCIDFKNKCENLISKHKTEVVSMFESALSKTQLHSEYRSGARFAWNQCNYYPKEVCCLLSDEDQLPKFKKYFYEKLHEPWNYPIDRYIAFVLGKNKIRYWMEVPFLVQHLPLKSNFKGRPINRQSNFFIDDEHE